MNIGKKMFIANKAFVFILKFPQQTLIITYMEIVGSNRWAETVRTFEWENVYENSTLFYFQKKTFL